jgi:hypothetical protein
MLIEFALTRDGEYYDAESVVLSNEAGTAGVTRNDTGAVVVAAGTAMTRVSLGHYEYEFTTPALGVDYTRYYKVTVPEDVFYDEDVESDDGASGRYATYAELASEYGADNLREWSDLNRIHPQPVPNAPHAHGRGRPCRVRPVGERAGGDQAARHPAPCGGNPGGLDGGNGRTDPPACARVRGRAEALRHRPDVQHHAAATERASGRSRRLLRQALRVARQRRTGPGELRRQWRSS